MVVVFMVMVMFVLVVMALWFPGRCLHDLVPVAGDVAHGFGVALFVEREHSKISWRRIRALQHGIDIHAMEKTGRTLFLKRTQSVS